METATRKIERRRHRGLQGRPGALLSLGVELKEWWHLSTSVKAASLRTCRGMEEPKLFSKIGLLTKDTLFALKRFHSHS